MSKPIRRTLLNTPEGHGSLHEQMKGIPCVWTERLRYHKDIIYSEVNLYI